ncbi:YbaK/EbsC family protein, partial [Salmonella enterica]|uniref:YbaK/EbsC family protein n=1 Tax=Salmonella enterica TaxID=28901 RepID=UPI000CB4BE45
TIAYSTESDHAANLEMASSKFKERTNTEVQLEQEIVDTPATTTIEDLTDFLNVNKANILKSVLLVADGEQPILAVVRGDHEMN